MAKVRLVKGPFAGKVMEVNYPRGATAIRITGPKPMSRKAKYEWQRHYIMNNLSSPHPSLLSKEMENNPAFPRVDAEYRIVMMPHYGQAGINVVACMHPDGSLFYEYVPGSKKEY
jgi:hypothetical protein